MFRHPSTDGANSGEIGPFVDQNPRCWTRPA